MKSVLWAALLAILLAACAKRETPVEHGNRNQILHLGNQVEPADLDPHITTGVSEINIHMALFEGLVSPHPEDLSPIPGVAEKWEISGDGRIYTFYLRKNARWSNGDPLTTDDFVFSIKRILSPALGAANADLLFVLKNAREYHSGETDDFTLVGVESKSGQILEFVLEEPTPYFLSLLLHPAWYPVHAPTLLAHGTAVERATGWTQSGHHIGNGPFRLKEWSVNEVVTVEGNPFYWAAEQVRLREIRFYPIENLNTEELAFKAGQLHVTEQVPSAKLAHYRQENSPFLRLDPYLGTEYYQLNTTIPPLDDSRVRRALSLALDRQSLADNVKGGGQEAAFHFTPPKTAGYISYARIEEDVRESRRLLAEAGFPDGEGFPTLELLFNSSENNKAMAEAIQQMWKTALGIQIELRNQEYKVYLDSRNRGNFQIARSSWIGDYNDPNTFLQLWISNSGNNHSRWSNPYYDRLIHQATQTGHQPERLKFFAQAEALLLEESPIIPLYFYVNAYLIRPEVKNWHANLLDWHPYKYVYLETQK